MANLKDIDNNNNNINNIENDIDNKTDNNSKNSKVNKSKSTKTKTNTKSKSKKKTKGTRTKNLIDGRIMNGNGAMNVLKNLEEGDNTKFLQLNMELFNMPSFKIRDATEEEIIQRLNDYFVLYAKYDMKPTVAGMAIALGTNRQTLWAITHDGPMGGRGNEVTLPKNKTDLIKNAYNLLENLWENYMVSGKINPVSGIFLGKNNYGYQDKTEYVVTPKTDSDEYSAADIRERYIGQANDYRLSDNANDSQND